MPAAPAPMQRTFRGRPLPENMVPSFTPLVDRRELWKPLRAGEGLCSGAISELHRYFAARDEGHKPSSQNPF
jgi:hypothetical protein